MKRNKNSLLLDIGWCEWVAFPHLKIPAIEAQIVTETRYSTLSIFDYSTFKEGDDLMVSFGIHPIQNNTDVEVYSVMPVKNRRLFTPEQSDRQWCYSIETELRIGSLKKNVELYLVKDGSTVFRLQLASHALKRLANIYPQKSYMTGHIFNLAQSLEMAG